MSKGNQWTSFVKGWAEKNGTSYMEAIKNPSLSEAYKQCKKDTKREAKLSQYEALKADAVALAEQITPFPVKKPRGRPAKKDLQTSTDSQERDNITLHIQEDLGEI